MGPFSGSHGAGRCERVRAPAGGPDKCPKVRCWVRTCTDAVETCTPAHCNGVSCSRCSRSICVCSRCHREQKSPMMTRGYVRFSGLFPVFPVNQGDTRKEAHARHATARSVAGGFGGAGGQVAGLRLALRSWPERVLPGDSLKGNSRPGGRVVSAAEKGWTVNGVRWTPIAEHYQGPTPPPLLGPSRLPLVRVIRCACSDCFTTTPKGVKLSRSPPKKKPGQSRAKFERCHTFGEEAPSLPPGDLWRFPLLMGSRQADTGRGA